MNDILLVILLCVIMIILIIIIAKGHLNHVRLQILEDRVKHTEDVINMIIEREDK